MALETYNTVKQAISNNDFDRVNQVISALNNWDLIFEVFNKDEGNITEHARITGNPEIMEFIARKQKEIDIKLHLATSYEDDDCSVFESCIFRAIYEKAIDKLLMILNYATEQNRLDEVLRVLNNYDHTPLQQAIYTHNVEAMITILSFIDSKDSLEGLIQYFDTVRGVLSENNAELLKAVISIAYKADCFNQKEENLGNCIAKYQLANNNLQDLIVDNKEINSCEKDASHTSYSCFFGYSTEVYAIGRLIAENDCTLRGYVKFIIDCAIWSYESIDHYISYTGQITEIYCGYLSNQNSFGYCAAGANHFDSSY